MTFEEYRKARLDELIADVRVYSGGNRGQNTVEGLIDLVRETMPGSVLELGCNRGVSTEIFLLHCPRVYCVDSWEGAWEPMFDEFKARVIPYPNLERVVIGRSPEALAHFPTGIFDMCYIDAEHDYASVVSDINACRPLVREDGWMAGHDCLPGSDVERAVRELLGEPKVFGDTSWLIKTT